MSKSGKIRLFVALTIPSDLKDQIRALPQTLLDYKRLTHPDDLHVTLRFLGDLDESLLPSIEQALDAMKKPANFNLESDGLSIFGKKGKAVLYARIPSVRKLSNLAEAITHKMEPLGLTFEKREFVPHITAARLKDDRNTEPYIRKYASMIRHHWTVTAFHLMKSASAEEGEKRYTILRSYDLAPY